MATQNHAELKGVEIFDVGVHKGDKYTQADIDRIVGNFSKLREQGIKPPLKLGHDEEQILAQKDGQPALGWVSSLKAAGGKILADFTDVPKALVNLIAKRRYKRVSSEIYRDWEGFGKTLAAVGLLGADVPVVKSLDDLDKVLASETPLVPDDAQDGDGSPGEATTVDFAVGSIEGVKISNLPDSSFAYIEPGGTKDEEGKTTPRSLRHFPILGPTGKPDAPHVRNALARASQSPFGPKALPKIRAAAAKLGIGEPAMSDICTAISTRYGEQGKLHSVQLGDDGTYLVYIDTVDEGLLRHVTINIGGTWTLDQAPSKVSVEYKEIADKKSEEEMDKEKELIELKAKLAETEKRAGEAETAKKKEEAEKVKLAEAETKLKADLEKKTKEADEAVKAKLASDAAARHQAIDAFVDKAARNGHLRKKDRDLATAILLRASEDNEKVTFKDADDKETVREVSQRKLIEEFIESLKLIDFSEGAETGERRTVDDAHKIANERALAMLKAKDWKADRYGEALTTVFAEDAELSKAYERESRGGA